MSSDVLHSEAIEFTRHLRGEPAVSFDPEGLLLRGQYRDELSAHRAKKVWQETLEGSFLLDQGQDFALSVRDLEEGERHFELRCAFHTACARYAFWRLTNNQAPEAQYMIETAHIPVSETHHEQFLHAPDMVREPMLLNGTELRAIQDNATVGSWLRKLVLKLTNGRL